jgi:GNAT superfamily N-acetyltransferase
MTADVAYRPMVVEDVPAAGAIQRATHVQRAERLHEPHEDKPQERIAVFERTLARFVRADHDGMPLCHVAERDGSIVGYAAAIRREDLWGLALLFVTPDEQGRGIGQGLLERSLTSAADARVRLIRASDHPQAARRYFAAGLRLIPAARFSGTPDRTTLPTDLPGRIGTTADLDLVEHVDRQVRGPTRTSDAQFAMEQDGQLLIVDGPDGRGWVLNRPDQGPRMLGATTPAAGRALLWTAFAHSDPEATLDLDPVFAEHQWAVQVAMAARLPCRQTSPLFIDGWDHPPEGWMPSGVYF